MVTDRYNNQFGSQQHWTKKETGIKRTLAKSVKSGKVFYNAFRATSYGCGQKDYNFKGSEYY